MALAQPAVGLSTVRSQRFGNENLLGFYTPQDHDRFADSLAVGDFNGDGIDDLATGMGSDNGLAGNEVPDSGSVVVRSGVRRDGLATGLAGTVLRQTSALDPPEAGDVYGAALAACDFNGDSFDDLAVGIPGEDSLGKPDGGAVQVHFGGSSGIHFAGDQFFTQNSPGVVGDVESGDQFGFAIACGDFNGDGFDDLAVGLPLETFESFGLYTPIWHGMVNILPGSAVGLDPQAANWALKHLDQDVPGMLGGAEGNDMFGWGLGVGDFNGDGFADLAVGVPGEDDNAGDVHVVFGSPGGLTAAGNVLIDEGDLGIPVAGHDRFGSAFAIGDFDGSGFDDLAIGAPDRRRLLAPQGPDAGGAVVIPGSPAGLDLVGRQFWNEDTIWFPGATEQQDFFGFALAAGDFDKDGFEDLAFGHPGEFLFGPQDGAVTVIMGSPAGLAAARRRSIAAGVEGFPGDSAQTGKAFAHSLASGDFDSDGHADLVLGSPQEDEPGIFDAGAETVLYGAIFADGVENGNAGLWSQVQPSAAIFGNRVFAATGAKLGPPSSKLGLQVSLSGTVGPAAFVRVGPDRGFHDERLLSGTLFIDPQSLTMSSAAGANVFQMVAFSDSLGAGARTRLAFDLVRTATNYSLVANFHDDGTNALQFAGSGVIADAGDPNGHNTRLDYEWQAGNPGHLTMWKTRFVGGFPDASGRVQLFSVDLPNMGSAVVNHVLVGMISGQDVGTTGALFFDELSFRR